MRRAAPIAAYIAFLLLLLEGFGQVAVRIVSGVWPLADRGEANALIFQAHPYLVGVPRPSVTVRRSVVTVSIDSLGYRGPDFPRARSDSVLRLLALGGSTTFGHGVDDHATWPVQLQAVLDSALRAGGAGPYQRAEVIDGGVPGYTTAENIIQLALLGVHLHPHVVVLFQGLNDLRNGHSPRLRTDYANFHGISQRGNLELDRLRRGNRSGLVRLGRTLLVRLFVAPAPQLQAGPRRAGVDPTAEAIFRANLRTFASICRGHGVSCLFVPQVVTDSFPVDQWWFPYLEPGSLAGALARYDSAMAAVADSTGTAFAGAVLQTPWSRRDFLDYCHFSPVGGQKFARVIAPYVQRLAEVAPR